MDNAIEAEIQEPIVEQRLIHISVSSQRKFVLIKVENYYDKQIVINNGLLKTTKMNVRNHGYGLKSIQYSVEKYSGMMTIAVNKKWFVLSIMIPLKEDGD